ncbi:MAG: hypothetical protein MZV49_17475, partial [Rhodopseudomonas palustris]|nr:hypothetical protein [Rhodopseudomonas palustris]
KLRIAKVNYKDTDNFLQHLSITSVSAGKSAIKILSKKGDHAQKDDNSRGLPLIRKGTPDKNEENTVDDCNKGHNNNECWCNEIRG